MLFECKVLSITHFLISRWSSLSPPPPPPQKKEILKAHLHGMILLHAISFMTRLRLEKSCRILKHFLKPYDNRGLKSVPGLHATKLYRINWPLGVPNTDLMHRDVS